MLLPSVAFAGSMWGPQDADKHGVSGFTSVLRTLTANLQDPTPRSLGIVTSYPPGYEPQVAPGPDLNSADLRRLGVIPDMTPGPDLTPAELKRLGVVPSRLPDPASLLDARPLRLNPARLPGVSSLYELCRESPHSFSYQECEQYRGVRLTTRSSSRAYPREQLGWLTPLPLKTSRSVYRPQWIQVGNTTQSLYLDYNSTKRKGNTYTALMSITDLSKGPSTYWMHIDCSRWYATATFKSALPWKPIAKDSKEEWVADQLCKW